MANNTLETANLIEAERPDREDGTGAPPVNFLAGGGEMGERIRAMDWAKTPIGPIEGWTLSLRTMVSLMLANRFPLLLWWGSDYVSIYNDAYRPVLGAKHPWALGTPVRECWSEIWDVLKPLIDAPFRGGPPTWSEDLPLEINRHGFLEETHFTVAYSPVPEENAPTGIGGVLATVHEITEKIVGERRINALRDLGAHGGEAKTAEEACSIAIAAVGGHAKDVPFAALYLFDDKQNTACLAGATGVEPGEPAAPLSIPVGSTSETDQAWPAAELLRSESTIVVEGLAQRFSKVPPGPWSDAPHTAVVVPIKSNAARKLAAFLVVGVSSRLRLDGQYRTFFELLASQIATLIATARAYEEERERADALAEIDRAKTAFFSNVSHEFRTPLTLMLGPLEDALASAEPVSTVQRERLEIAHRNALRLLRLVNSLLDFSRIEAGRVEANYLPTDLAALTADLVSSFRSATDKAGLRLTVDTPPLSQAAYVDRDMWEKIVLNLVSNAFKFTFEGEISVALRERDGTARLTVRDTGTGIPASQIEKLFDRFHRVEGARGRSFEGSGIGLALVRELVKLHMGDIAVESEEGRGTAFHVTLPLGTAHLPPERVKTALDETVTAARSQTFVEEALRWLPAGAGDVLMDAGAARDMPSSGAAYRVKVERRRVLMADDNADLRDYVSRLLANHGYEVETVADGEAALAALRARRPDILVTDVMMPRLDGFGLLRAVREDASLRDLPVVMLSARAGDDAKVEGLDAGADDYLTKPFSARELLARVAANIAMAKLRREAAEAVSASEAALRELNQQLESRVQLAIEQREQAEEALRQSQKMEAVGQLTGGIAHDFNNLLAGISGSLHMLQTRIAQGQLDAVPRYIDAAQGATKRAAALTQRLLAFSRRQTLDPKPTDLNRLIADMEELVRRTTGPNIAVEVVGAAGLWPVLIDPNQLENALLNLCINARDAMPDGGRLTIETANRWLDADEATERDLAPGQYVSLSVTDTGIGMSKETIGRIFDPFFTTKPLGQGTGLGLSMIYGFVRQSNGQVSVSSEMGRGTAMCLYLPRHHGEATSSDTAEEGIAGIGTGYGETVLVVDDDPTVRLLMVDALQDAGYRVLEAADGPEGLKILQSEIRIHLLLTDVGLPGGMNGRQVADAGRALRPSLKVLFITGYAETAVVGRDHLDPGMQVITKPFAIDALAHKVRRLIDT